MREKERLTERERVRVKDKERERRERERERISSIKWGFQVLMSTVLIFVEIFLHFYYWSRITTAGVGGGGDAGFGCGGGGGDAGFGGGDAGFGGGVGGGVGGDAGFRGVLVVVVVTKNERMHLPHYLRLLYHNQLYKLLKL